MESMRITIALLAIAGVCSAGDAMFRGDAIHSGVYQSGTVPTLAAVKWKFKNRVENILVPSRR